MLRMTVELRKDAPSALLGLPGGLQLRESSHIPVLSTLLRTSSGMRNGVDCSLVAVQSAGAASI